MLSHLSIKNFTIIENLEIEFKPHMTVLTGETGAGKSIIVDTLGIVLGSRVDGGIIYPGKEKCEITAVFDLTNLPLAKKWLITNELSSDDENECIIRRSINKDGRTRSTINGYPCTQQLVRDLGGLLLNIHGQNEHQFLLKCDTQRDLLDAFAGNSDVCLKVENAALKLKAVKNELTDLENNLAERNAKLDLLHYQLAEFDKLALKSGEVLELEQELKRLGNAENIMEQCKIALDIVTDGENNLPIISSLHTVRNCLEKINFSDPKIIVTLDLLENARINLETVADNIHSYLADFDLDPERYNTVSTRINAIYDLSRKHHVKPENLCELYTKLQMDLENLECSVLSLEKCKTKVSGLEKIYFEEALKLSVRRKQAAHKLSSLITEKMQLLMMQGGDFAVDLKKNDENIISVNGREDVEFLVTTNSNQPLKSLRKVVSGGELSRISLAIQVVISKSAPNLTLFFDEVDVGIGGKTAEIVGLLLKKIGGNQQIICITHLPQVAALGDTHLKVEKESVSDATNVMLKFLNNDERVLEIARMLGGINITDRTIAHATEMLGL